ncbi:MAG: DUF4350 domain-containing protein [Proteobacteria bacterium]|nr:DUF4350 domain-containing protein [Pseudomonadota bacterium]
MIKKLFLLLTILVLISPASAENLNKVLFDEGHGQPFLISKEGNLQLSNLAKILREEGLELFTSDAPFSKNFLKDYKSVIISGPFKEISKQETEELFNFVSDGGNLVVMLHISLPAEGLFKRFGVEITRGSVSESENLITKGKNIDFEIKNLSNNTLFRNLTKFSVYGAWGLISEKDDLIIAKTSNKSWVDLNRNGIFDDNEPKGPFGIIASGIIGKGKFIFFGDDTIFQNNFLKDENLTLAKNLARVLKEGF